MATLNVSSAAELRSAINSASGGDTILLADGSYGDVSLNRASDVTIQARGNNAVLNELDLRNADNVKIDGLTFEGRTDGSGYGTGTAVEIKSSSDVTIENSDFSDYAKGLRAWDVSGLKVSGNTLDNISFDGLVFGHVHGARITGNDVTMHGRENVDHKDVIQFFNQGDKAAASDVVIANNTLTAEDPNIHGIYMGNADASNTGRASEYYSDITISGNVIDVQHMLGVAVGQTDGLAITDNVVLRHGGADGAREINSPRILVDHDSDNVRVSGNTVLETPSAAGSNWQPDSASGGGWSISGNSVVSVGTSIGGFATGSDTGSDSGSGATPGTATSAADGADVADVFRFTGDRIDGDVSARIEGADFGAGAVLKLGHYDAGTFDDVLDGNIVQNNASGSYVKIDSLTDIAELAAHSDAVAAHVSGDDLRVTIEQDSGTLDLVLAGLGQDYQNGYDATLF
jgi:hypothetical protein